MAKRAPIEEKAFSPLNAAVLNSVLRHQPQAPATHATHREPPPAQPRPGQSPIVQQPMHVRSETRLWPSENEPVRTSKKLDAEKRILLSREEQLALDRMVTALAVQLQAQIKSSHIFRALVLLLLHAEGAIQQRAADHGPMLRPANGDMAGIERFERQLAQILAAGLRDGAPLRER